MRYFMFEGTNQTTLFLRHLVTPPTLTETATKKSAVTYKLLHGCRTMDAIILLLADT
jgi:hypothetical protein